MQSHTRAFFWAAALLFLPAGNAQEVADSPKPESHSLEEIVAALEKNEQAIETLAVTMKAKRESSLGQIFGNGDVSRWTFTEKWHIDTAMRGWTNARGETTITKKDGRVTTKSFESQSATNGKQASQLTTEWTGRRNASTRGNVGPALIRYGLSPLDFTIGHQGKLVSPMLREPGAKFVRHDNWDNHRVVVVESATAGNQEQYKSQFWIDTGRNYTIVRRQNLSRTNNDAPWHVFYSVDSFKHKRHDDGIWLATIAWRRSFGQPTAESPKGQLISRCDVNCTEWKVNDPLDKSELQIDFPAGVKVHGLERQIPVGFQKSKNFFVAPIETDLQRLLLGDSKSTTYVNVDATAIANVNTLVVDPMGFDFAALKSKLQTAAKNHKKPRLMLHIDFGSLGTDDDLLRFIKAPLKELASTAGFKDVRMYSTHGGSRIWKAPDDSSEPDRNESDLGNDDWQVFAVGTRLSRYFANDSDYFIRSKNGLDLDTSELLDDQAIQTIRNAIKDRSVDGKRLEIKIRIGGNRDDPDQLAEKQIVKQGSKVQLNCVDQLRDIGFGRIQLIVQVGHGNFVSTYQQ